MRRFLGIIVVCLCLNNMTQAQTSVKNDTVKTILKEYFANYKAQDTKTDKPIPLQDYSLDDSLRTLLITAGVPFTYQEFTPQSVKKIYKDVKAALPHPYDKYDITIYSGGQPIEKYIPNYLAEKRDESRAWRHIKYDGKPWVSNMSTPRHITQGLSNRHITVWASHGRYYDNSKRDWQWQRPNLFCTTEDLFTQTIVVPFLIPMLENAGAVVFTPRERDWQKKEYIVDNDTQDTTSLFTTNGTWTTTEKSGFAYHNGTYTDRENPFLQGTALKTATTSSHKDISQACYQPNIESAGKYAVYVSYQTEPESVDDVCYTVYHKGQSTIFHVNQKMGGGTWVYLGTFDFDAGCNEYNRVVIDNQSKHDGIVTTDAVRFGGGMGNIVRGGQTSGLPRCLEAARYYTQWAGAPSNIVSVNNGASDYKDDINCRSLMENWIAGGSCFVPETNGLGVPIEMSLAVHSDAGVSLTDDIVGTLSICTTKNDDKGTSKELLGTDVSRMASRDFADALLTTIYRDMKHHYGKWTRRSLWDRNYNETRRPEVPSSIIETLSHQNFMDMRYGHDPNFKFNLARAIYKAVLRQNASMHNTTYVVQPLQPKNFRIELTSGNKATLHWSPQEDVLEESATPNSYIVYTATGTMGFDNGTKVTSTSMSIDLQPGVVYHFKVTACNKGGESFPTETLSACYQGSNAKDVLIVNGFQRLASPAIVNDDVMQGFDMNDDPGVQYGRTAGWAGKQTNFDRTKAGKEGSGALGYCGDEYAGVFVAGNDFNYVSTHADAIASAKIYNIVSCSRDALEKGEVTLERYDCVDIIMGLERNDGYSLKSYKTFPTKLQEQLRKYAKKHGNILISGSYVASDMTAPSEVAFLQEVLKVNYAGTEKENQLSRINGLGNIFDIYRTLNERHYAATAPDALHAVGNGFGAMQYEDGRLASVAYKGKDYSCFTVGFPLECIIEAEKRNAIIRGIMAFLTK